MLGSRSEGEGKSGIGKEEEIKEWYIIEVIVKGYGSYWDF